MNRISSLIKFHANHIRFNSFWNNLIVDLYQGNLVRLWILYCLLQVRQWIKNNDNLINLLRGEKTFYGQPWYIIRLCSLLFANEKIYLYFKYARYILKPDKIGQEEPIGFGCDPEKRNKILFPQKKKTFLDDITPYI